MKISAQWLREWVDPAANDASINTQFIADKLTMAGLEVDGIEKAAPEFKGIVVAQIESVEAHPDADKLRVCQVNKGDEVVQIVCGAPNVRQGMLAPLATVGGAMPPKDGKAFKIKKAKLRGVESFGMLCSAVELGLADQADGLWDLPETLTVGDDLHQALQLNDEIIDIDLTPNRADALSVRGIAREVGVLTKTNLSEPTVKPVPATTATEYGVTVTAADACPIYLARVVEGIDNQMTSPLWMTERLRRAGVRPLSIAVDVTNYVLLELGQPMHAFDRSKLQGDINVRYAEENEKLVLLDGQTITMTPDTLVIADDKGAIALAGVMGGERTAVDGNTKDIVFEAAHFVPTAIAGKARAYGLHTDSSHRFERGVDPQLPNIAMERATGLLQDIVDGVADAGIAIGPVTQLGQAEAADSPVVLRRARIVKVLGLELPDDEVVDILQRLNMDLTANDQGWLVSPPSARFDIKIEVDLIEELARIHGYDQLPVQTPMAELNIEPQPENRTDLGKVQNLLVARGYYEAITYSFVEPKMQTLLFPEMEGLSLANPISADLAVMRISLFPGLIRALQHNLNRQQNRLRLFETGLRFVPDTQAQDGMRQELMVSGLVYGDVLPEQWGSQNADCVDFYDVKSDVEALFSASGKVVELNAPSKHASDKLHALSFVMNALHPGQSAEILIDNHVAGVIGALHPKLTKALGLSQPVYLFELLADAVQTVVVPSYELISKFPTVRRDLALVVPESVPAADLLKVIDEAVCESIQDNNFVCRSFVFDVFKGSNIKSGYKSIALGLVMHNLISTLTDEQTDSVVDGVVKALSAELNAEVRV